MASEFDNLMLDPLVKRRAETGTDVDPASEEGRQVSLEGHKVEQRAPLLEVYEQVEVARVGRVAGDGAEHTRAARTVATRDGKDVSPSRAELTERHSRNAGAATNFCTSSSILRTCWRPSLPQHATRSRPAHRHWLAPDPIHTVAPPRWE
jgi:hypothetical protein